MGERLRGRDARNNSNKCYAAFFEDGDDDPHHSSAKTAKMKISRSPPKKRESPKKRSKRAALTTVQNSLELGVAVHVPVDGGSDVLTKQPVETSSAFVANVTTKTITPSYSPKECDQRTTKMGEGQCVEVCVAGKKEVDEGVEVEVRELNGEENITEHVVVSDDDEEDMKSESLKSNNNNKRKFSASSELNSLQLVEHLVEANGGDEDIKKLKLNSVKDQMFEIFQPWALTTYGDQAKTKTITQRKKNRILKALDGKEQNNPDSSKFRFWVKSKGFTVQRPQNFFGYSSPGEVTSEKGAAIYKLATAVGALQGQASTVQEMDTQKDHIDLYVASTVKDFGERVYRKVAVVEEFFEIIYNVHVERGGRNGRHAGQKRTYRIITETYAFLPREAVTKFLTSCPTCKKNLRPFSPSRFDDTFTESSSEYEALNYSSQNESSVDSLQLGPIRSVRRKAEGKASPLVTNSYSECVDTATSETKCDRKRYNEAVFNFDKNSSKIEEPTKFDDKFKLGQDFLSSEKFSFLERPKVGEGYPFTERFNMNNLLRPEFLHKGMIGLHGLFTRNEQLNIDSRFHANEKWNQMHYPLSPNYYQYFGKPPRTPCNSPVGHRERICDKIPAGTPNNENLDSSIDLTINQASSININIGSSPDAKSQSSGSTKKLKLDHSDEVCFNTVDVSINMLNSSNELKISCKTTPPKKRYNAFRDKESNPLSTLSASYSNTTTGDSVIGDENCAMNLSKTFRSELSEMKPAAMKMAPTGSTVTAEPFQVDLSKVKPITSTYLRMTRSFGLSDEDALRIDDLETLPTPGTDPALAETNPEEAYAGLMKDADKLKLMLLAWNYQNSNAIRNGAEAPDLGVVGGLWAQYQNALALNAKQPSVSPINRTEQPSPIENQDETNSSGQKDEDDGSEDDSDDKLDQNAHDPERLKAFNMFVRLFVDENLDRMIPISKQPKEKIQAIIDSCARQFPEFCERSRKRIRTYLKSCRRNKKAREGWDNASRPTPAHLTSVQAEQILAMACENESLNAKRMRIGLDPISQSLPLTSNSTVTTDVVAPSITYPGFRATPSTTAVSTSELDAAQPSTTTQTVSSARSSPISLTTNLPAPADSKPNTPAVNGTVTSQIASPLYRPTEFTSPTSTSSPYTSSTRPTAAYPVFFPASNNVNATPTDLSMKQHTPTTTQPCNQQLPTLPVNTGAPVPASGRPPLLSHKLNPNEMSAVRQLITGYRESAAFLLRSADELEQLLLQQQ